MKLKYVIVKVDGFDQPFLFSELPNHRTVAYQLVHEWTTACVEDASEKIISAGFCFYDRAKETWMCYGESTSLKLKSRPEDAAILNQAFDR